MANLFLEDPIYITSKDLLDSTRNKCLKSSDKEDDRKILIRKSEIIIDSVISAYGTKVEPDQRNVFPVIDELIPINIQKATILLCEGLFEGGELEGSNNSPEKGGMIKSEKYGLHTVEYQDQGVIKSALSNKSKYITDEIELLLKPYINSNGVRWSKGV